MQEKLQILATYLLKKTFCETLRFCSTHFRTQASSPVILMHAQSVSPSYIHMHTFTLSVFEREVACVQTRPRQCSEHLRPIRGSRDQQGFHTGSYVVQVCTAHLKSTQGVKYIYLGMTLRQKAGIETNKNAFFFLFKRCVIDIQTFILWLNLAENLIDV